MSFAPRIPWIQASTVMVWHQWTSRIGIRKISIYWKWILIPKGRTQIWDHKYQLKAKDNHYQYTKNLGLTDTSYISRISHRTSNKSYCGNNNTIKKPPKKYMKEIWEKNLKNHQGRFYPYCSNQSVRVKITHIDNQSLEGACRARKSMKNI